MKAHVPNQSSLVNAKVKNSGLFSPKSCLNITETKLRNILLYSIYVEIDDEIVFFLHPLRVKKQIFYRSNSKEVFQTSVSSR